MTAHDAIQAERILRVETPLGPDVLLPERMELREGVGGLFEARVAVRSKEVALAPGDLIGRPVDVSLETAWGRRRTWNALCTELVEHPRLTRGLRSYRLVLRPAAWVMTQRSDARIWMGKTAVEVAETLLAEHGLPSPDVSGVVEPVEPHHYSVQWLETDWDYLVRRLEADGLWHWFRHEGGSPGSVSAVHRLHLANHQAGWRPGGEAPDGGDVRYSLGSADRNRIDRFVRTYAMRAGARAGRDWNFLTPSHTPEGTTPTLHALPRNGPLELFEYPSMGGWGPEGGASDGIDAARVEARSRLRMQATEADHERVEGGGDVRSLAPGRRFTPYDVANPDQVFEEHVATAVLHRVVDRSYETAQDEPDYACAFEAVPSRVPLTPHRTTARPRIDGQQIAVVAGPMGEEIHPDAHGRVKLWFPWDRRAAKDGTDTCWVRVAQSWAGAGWGAQTIPRIGMEVLVSYLDGDPDRPIVTGAVPNAQKTTPYELPRHKTRTVLRSNTHRSGDPDQFNEISFEDEAGREDLFLHAQRDQTTKVLNDQSANVGRHRVEHVGENASLTVQGNARERTHRNKSVAVGGVGFAMLGLIGPLMQAGGRLLSRGGAEAGAEPVAGMGGHLSGAAEAGAEVSSLLGWAGFRRSGRHRPDQGVEQAAAASALGAKVGALMMGRGTLTSFVERFRNDTVGLSRSEQVGLVKSTVVGNVQKTAVGKLKTLVVGEDYDYEARRSIFGRTTRHTLTAKERFVVSGPGGSITIDASGITIRTKHLKVRSPRVDFLSGSPDQTAALQSDKPFVEECRGK